MMFTRVFVLLLVVLCQGCDAQKVPDFGSSKVVSGRNSNKEALQQSPIESYKDARRIFWKSLYPGQTQSLYCGKKFNSKQRKGFNVEHVFPMSWAVNGLDCGTRKQCRNRSAQFNFIEADMHNLFPARSDVNQQRSSYRFGVISGEKRIFGSQCDFEVDRQARVAEPAPEVRGDVARAMFYMAYRYKSQGLVLFEKQAKLLYKWHLSDAPDAGERKRNDTIEKLQGNRNPFIDKPENIKGLVNSGFFF